MIRNPILKGFNPDPSIVRVGPDYFIATSTFEWYPGVQIHHSRDLVNWRLVTRPLDRASQLDLRGEPDSCGVWAPCLSYADGRFWLIYTDVKRYDGNFKDAHNYLVTAPQITGPWSDPIYMNSSGFDPSLFHDDDGRKWFVNQQWRHLTDSVGGKPKVSAFDGILLQEYDPVARKLTGPITNIFAGSPLGLVEGPHLFKRDDYYYLTTAEGGTGYDHAVTMARARTVRGPYELHPDAHLITSKDAPEAPLQRAGHGQIVETPEGASYHTHLCGRPLPDVRRCPLGRETAIQKVRLEGRRLALSRAGRPGPGGRSARTRRRPRARAGPPGRVPLRRPAACRRTSSGCAPLTRSGSSPSPAKCCASPAASRSAAGSSRPSSPAARSTSATAPRPASPPSPPTPTSRRRASRPTTAARNSTSSPSATTPPSAASSRSCPAPPTGPTPASASRSRRRSRCPDGPLDLAVEVDHANQQFFWRSGGEWMPAGPALDASLISDEAGRGEHGSFTGAFVGLLAFDTSGRAATADFASFAYRPG